MQKLHKLQRVTIVKKSGARYWGIIGRIEEKRILLIHLTIIRSDGGTITPKGPDNRWFKKSKIAKIIPDPVIQYQRMVDLRELVQFLKGR